MLSIVIPAYNEEKMILKTTEVVSGIMEREKIPFELVFVNDGSRDQTWEMIEKAAEKNSHVTGIRFSRNFGKESAILRALPMRRATVSPLWTVTCSIRQRLWWRCTVSGNRVMK